jgi:hypothetical protein
MQPEKQPTWPEVPAAPVQAVARNLQRRAVNTLTSQACNSTIGNTQQNLRGPLIEARRVQNAPTLRRRAVTSGSATCSSPCPCINDKLNLAQNVGDSEAESALRTTTCTASGS